MLDRLLDFFPNIGVDALDALLLLPVLVALEAVLSADNAIALAAIAQGLDSPKTQRNALNVGLIAAFILRIILILTATWVINVWQFELLGACYLLWLVFQYFRSETDANEHHHGPKFSNLWQAIPLIAITDLAFSLDSVTTAIALSQEVWLVITGGLIGVIALRFMAELFIRWINEYDHLEDAGFITVGLVGLRLLVRVIDPQLVPPEWLMVTIIGAIFAWGFSKRSMLISDASDAESEQDVQAPESDDVTPHTTQASTIHNGIERHGDSVDDSDSFPAHQLKIPALSVNHPIDTTDSSAHPE
ncbi:MAG: hypothetical protein AAFR31_14485 [Cyanobacteria bacterium J06627_8]